MVQVYTSEGCDLLLVNKHMGSHSVADFLIAKIVLSFVFPVHGLD